MNKKEAIITFGKWVETEAISIIKDKYGLREFKQSDDMYSRIDGVIFHDLKLIPIQIKARSPRIYFRDVSILLSQYEVYKEIADKNGGYMCFMICDIYNPAFGYDYVVYQFDFGDIKFRSSRTTGSDGTPSIYLKLHEMKKLDILPIEFQKELELKHIEMIRPWIDEKYINAYKNKFIKNVKK